MLYKDHYNREPPGPVIRSHPGQSHRYNSHTSRCLVKYHVNSPPLGSRYFPTFGGEWVDDFGLSFFRYDSPSITK